MDVKIFNVVAREIEFTVTNLNCGIDNIGVYSFPACGNFVIVNGIIFDPKTCYVTFNKEIER